MVDPIEGSFRRIVPLLDELTQTGVPSTAARAIRPVPDASGMHFDDVEVELPDVGAIVALVRSWIFGISEFNAAVQEIAGLRGVSVDEANVALQDAALGYVLYERDPAAAALDISARLAKEPVLCTWKAHVVGLTASAPVTFSDGSVLRPLRDEDRVRVEPKGCCHGWTRFKRLPVRASLNSAFEPM